MRALGFPVLRVRHHGIMGRVEIAAEDLDAALAREPEIAAAVRAAGYRHAVARPRAVPLRAAERHVASGHGRRAAARGRRVVSCGHDPARALRSHRPRVVPRDLRRRRPRQRLQARRRPRRSSCCSSTASTTSTSPPATATRSCASRPGCAATRASSSSRRRPASATYAAAREQIRRSLDRLGVDQVDSIQLHNLVDVIEWEHRARARTARWRPRSRRARRGSCASSASPATACPSPRCTAAASSASRSTRCCARTTTVQMQDDALRRDVRRRWPRSAPSATSRCRRSRASPRGRWDGRDAPRRTWYEPLREQADIDLAAHWVLGNPQVFLLTTGDVEILPRLLDAAERFESRPPDEQMAELAASASSRRCSSSRRRPPARTWWRATGVSRHRNGWRPRRGPAQPRGPTPPRNTRLTSQARPNSASPTGASAMAITPKAIAMLSATAAKTIASSGGSAAKTRPPSPTIRGAKPTGTAGEVRRRRTAAGWAPSGGGSRRGRRGAG